MRNLIMKLFNLVDAGQYLRLEQAYKQLMVQYKLNEQAVELAVGQQEWNEMKHRYKMRAH